MSSAYFAKSITKTKAKKQAWEAFSIYMRTLWTQKGFVECYTCHAHCFLKERPGKRVTVGHWIEGHGDISYVNENYVRPQCYRCNMMLGGNQGEFRDRIRKELGNVEVDRLIFEAKNTKSDLTAQDYLDLKAFYKLKLKELLVLPTSS
jgi:hypothetical protein